MEVENLISLLKQEAYREKLIKKEPEQLEEIFKKASATLKNKMERLLLFKKFEKLISQY